MGARQNVRTILIAAADGHASSSRIVAEFGVAIAESGRSVLLVGADMRGSSLAQIFDVPDVAGLSSLLTEGGDPEAFIGQPKTAYGAALPDTVASRLALLPNGPLAAQALAVLDSSAMVELLKSQRDSYEFVLLDAPSATAAADVVALAAHVDGVIVIAREARSRGRGLEALRHHLDRVGAHVVGGVFITKSRGARRWRRRDSPLPVGGVSTASAKGRAGQADVETLGPSPATGTT
jgi:Mrp family chromosome partitioning ATPase